MPLSTYAFGQVKFCYDEYASDYPEDYLHLTPAITSGEFGTKAYTEAKELVEYAIERTRGDIKDYPDEAKDLECHIAELTIALQEVSNLAKVYCGHLYL